LIEIGSKTAKKNSAQTNKQTARQTNRHYENNGHLAVNQNLRPFKLVVELSLPSASDSFTCKWLWYGAL